MLILDIRLLNQAHYQLTSIKDHTKVSFYQNRFTCGIGNGNAVIYRSRSGFYAEFHFTPIQNGTKTGL